MRVTNSSKVNANYFKSCAGVVERVVACLSGFDCEQIINCAVKNIKNTEEYKRQKNYWIKTI